MTVGVLLPFYASPPPCISKCPLPPSFPSLPLCSNGQLRTLSRPGQREFYEVVLTRNPPNQHSELMELDAKNVMAVLPTEGCRNAPVHV